MYKLNKILLCFFVYCLAATVLGYIANPAYAASLQEQFNKNKSRAEKNSLQEKQSYSEKSGTPILSSRKLYSKPDKTSPLVGAIQGQSTEALFLKRDRDWLYIDIVNGDKGWVHCSYIPSTFELDSPHEEENKPSTAQPPKAVPKNKKSNETVEAVTEPVPQQTQEAQQTQDAKKPNTETAPAAQPVKQQNEPEPPSPPQQPMTESSPEALPLPTDTPSNDLPVSSGNEPVFDSSTLTAPAPQNSTAEQEEPKEEVEYSE